MLRSTALIIPVSLLLAAADPEPAPRFVAHSASGTVIKGQLKQIDDQGGIVLDDGTTRRIGKGELISLRWTDIPLPAPPAGQQVIFAGGDRLAGMVGTLTGDRLAFTPSIAAHAGEMTLPFSALAMLWFADPVDVERPDLFRRRLLAEKRDRDLVWLRNGDIRKGVLLRLGPEILDLEVDGKVVPIARANLAVVALNNQLVRSLRPREPYYLLVLADGSRVRTATVQTEGTTLRGKTLFGAEIPLPLNQLAALDVFQGPAVYLSDLEPASYEYTPFANEVPYPWTADGSLSDGSPAGDDLRLAGSTFVKGIGMHSKSRLTWTLAGKYRRFESLVGLDDRTGQGGSVRIQVLVDGKVRDWGWDRDLTFQDGPKPVRLDVTGARELTLVVDYGGWPRFVQGRVNWGDARLIKQQ
jgi:hypothetical protein